MSNGETVPVEWVIGLIIAVVSMFAWWVRVEFGRNAKDHDDIEQRIIDHDLRTEKASSAINSRIDHLIINTPGMPSYKEGNDRRP